MQGKIGRAEFFSLALVLCLNSVVLLGAVEKTAGPLSWLVLVAALPTGLPCCNMAGLVLWFVGFWRLFSSFTNFSAYARG